MMHGLTKTYPLDQSCAELFEAQAARTPDDTAVIFESQRLTYSELNRRANQLACLLRKLGTQRGDFVGVFLERHCDFLVAMLAVFKAGGAYIPIEPLYPDDRIQYMLANSEARTLLTHSAVISHFASKLPPGSALQNIVCLDQKDAELSLADSSIQRFDSSDFTSLPEANPALVNSATDPAYMIYTSGSTGLPKGAIVRHNGAVNHIYAQFDALALGSDLCFLQSAPSSSDISVWQFLAPLFIGGRTLIIDTESLCDSQKLVRILREQHVTIIEIVPAVLRGLLDYLAPLPEAERALPALKWLMVTGEAVAKTLVNRWLELYPAISVVNAYGPTECADDVTQYIIDQPLPELMQTVPIGKPLANLSVYIVDEALSLTPDGVAGEICIAGVGVGMGYWKEPEKTANSFVPNPFNSSAAGNVLYKTGDLGRWLADGNIEYLGRIDHQVKIRGFRIELEEIEAKLGAHPGVRETVLLADEDELGNQRLIAYVVPRTEPGPSSAELRDYLQDKLPAHMLPAAYVLLESFPLTPNGKVDRKALPRPHGARPELAEAYLAPATPMQETLSALWAELLQLDRVGVNDNFFALGGHSLLATQMVLRLRDSLRVELPLRTFFEASTIAALSEKIARALQDGAGLDALPIVPAPRDQALPLSFAQQRLWFLQALDHGGDAYNMPEAIRLSGTLDSAALSNSLNEIVRRHEALRTTFTTLNGQAVQLITPNLNLPLPIMDLTALPEAQHAAEIERLALQEGKQAFDLATGPLLRCSLLRLSAREHVLFLMMHHIVSDDWSMGIFIREIAALYDAFAQDKASPLPELIIQYADFAAWQQRWLQGEILETQVAYWKNQLGGLALLELPTDRPRPPVQRFVGATQTCLIPLKLARALRALSRREGVTLFMTLLAAFNTLLYRYCGQEDIVVGTPVANRNREEIEGLIGFFVNTLVLRTDVSGNPDFRTLLGRVRATAFGAYAHQDLPFEKLVEALQPERDLSRNPLFQVMFALQNAAMSAIETEHLTLTPLELDPGTAKFDLTLLISEHGEALKATLEYNEDLFDAPTIVRMLGHFQTLLEGIVAAPETAIASLPLMGEAERRQMLIEWNDTHADYPQNLCAHQLFEAQAARTPDAIAAVRADQSLSYRELNQQANQLAHYLLSAGVTPGALIGICMERSLELLVGLLGILKAGGAYLPLDPAYPQERLAFMLEDAQAKLVLSSSISVSALPKLRANVVCLDTAWPSIAQYPEHAPPSQVSAEQSAYVIYTSGSTGRPKGVPITHRSLVNHNIAMADTFALCAADRVLQFASISFDISVEELFPSWLRGCTVVLRSDAAISSAASFCAFVAEHGITVLNLPTAYWQELVHALPDHPLPDKVRLMIIGGEKATTEHYARWQRHAPSRVELINAYGPTETTVTATLWRGTREPVIGCTALPIGRPIANTRCYILDRQAQPVPIGIPGELHIGGDGLTPGYLHRPELTAEKFIADPFDARPGARLYKSGDLVRYAANGDIEFLGRIDDQVKLRGFRIELGEIEALLAEHAAVRENAVVLRADEGGKRLVSYVVAHPESTATISELRDFLKGRLPDYMIPAAFVMLAALPLTPNGKIDRRALPAPDQTLSELTDSFIAPRDAIEEVIAAIWASVLNLQRVGVHDNFFDLGGHSLLAIQVLTRLRDALRLELSLRELFEAPSVAGVAVALVKHETAPGRLAETARLRRNVDTMSNDDIRALLLTKKRLRARSGE